MVFPQYSISRLQPSVFRTGVLSCSMAPRAWYTCCLPRNLMALLLCPGDPGNDRSQVIHEPRRDDEIGHVTLLSPGVQLLDDGIHAAHERCGRLQHVLRSHLQTCGELCECGLPMSGHFDV